MSSATVDAQCFNAHLTLSIQVKQIASAVAYIHDINKVHGNIVPVCLQSILFQQPYEWLDLSSSQTNVMITDDGRPCLSDVGLNAGLAKAILDSDRWPVPSGWMFKAPEELSFECEPASFIHTKAMDVYSLGITTYTVSLVCSMFVRNCVLIRHPLIPIDTHLQVSIPCQIRRQRNHGDHVPWPCIVKTHGDQGDVVHPCPQLRQSCI